jgi:tryptophan synthase alpha chain
MSTAVQTAPHTAAASAAAPGIARIEGAFAAARARGRKALVLYVMAGDPDPGFTLRLVPKLAAAGADLVELGYPFSDPVADGPVIQAAGQRALDKFATTGAFLDLVRHIRLQTPVPMVVMGYYNPIFRYGESAFVRDALAAGLDGAIVPDLPVVEAGSWREACLAQGFAPVALEAPNTPPDVARTIAEGARGFVYLVSLKGVTGTDRGLGENLGDRVTRLRQWTAAPLVVGFGISTPEHARHFGRLCDGIVVGSGVVSRIADARTPDAAEAAVLEYVRTMRAGLDAG